MEPRIRCLCAAETRRFSLSPTAAAALRRVHERAGRARVHRSRTCPGDVSVGSSGSGGGGGRGGVAGRPGLGLADVDKVGVERERGAGGDGLVGAEEPGVHGVAGVVDEDEATGGRVEEEGAIVVGLALLLHVLRVRRRPPPRLCLHWRDAVEWGIGEFEMETREERILLGSGQKWLARPNIKSGLGLGLELCKNVRFVLSDHATVAQNKTVCNT